MAKDDSEQLRTELKGLADMLEEVLNSSADKPKEELDKLRFKAQEALTGTRDRLSEAREKVVNQTKELANQAECYVRDSPWTSIGIGAAVGIVAGVLLGRR